MIFTYTMHCNSFDHCIRIKVVLYIPIFVTRHEKIRLMSTQNVTTFGTLKFGVTDTCTGADIWTKEGLL